MNSLIPIVLLPFLSAPFVAWIGGRSRRAAAWSAAAVTLLCLALLGGLISQLVHTNGLNVAHVISFNWMPSIGLEFAFRIDGLSLLFTGLILIIGLLVVAYARYYLAAQDSAARFFASLMLFMGAMLGIVLSENLIQMVVFWELT